MAAYQSEVALNRARDIEQDAALWLLRSEEPDWSDQDQRLLDDWLAQSDAHKTAYWRLEQGWRSADRVRSLGTMRAHETPKFDVARWRPFAAAACVLLVLITILASPIGTGSTQRNPTKVATFQTAVGGHRLVGLADGSKIELNTATVIRAQLDGAQRRVWLERGEAYFEVAKVPGQAFVVFAGPRNITVLGTKFVVRRAGPKVTVSVVEGRVRVDDIGSRPDAGSTTITTGDTAVAEGSMTLVKADSKQNVEEALAWRSGRLQFDSTTLSNAAAEFNRYNRRKLVIGDPAAGEMRIGGTFEADNVEAFARLLNEAYGLKVSSDQDKILISS